MVPTLYHYILIMQDNENNFKILLKKSICFFSKKKSTFSHALSPKKTFNISNSLKCLFSYAAPCDASANSANASTAVKNVYSPTKSVRNFILSPE